MRMRVKNSILIGVAAMLLMLTSCVTPRRVNYLQDMTHGSQIELEDRFEARIAPYDELSITVTSAQPSSEMAAPFNGGGKDGGGYLVDVNGDISFPVLGKLHVAGLTRLNLQDTLVDLLARGGYLDDPYVMVRFSNFKIFFIGNGTGKVLNVNNERCTFLEALAMSGGLDNYTRRDRIAVMREVDGQMVMRYLDPRSSDVFNDPFFMLQQNDFIITRYERSTIMQADRARWMPWVSIGVSFISLLTSLYLLSNR